MNQRKIKFRAYFLKDKEWWYGCFHPEIEKRNEMPFAVFFNKVEKYILINLGEFTGLLDKNGKEIYEGDIVKVRNPEQNSYQVILMEQREQNGGWPIMKIDEKFTEVIGNIYENPELLKP